jgi:hypothetical protein
MCLNGSIIGLDITPNMLRGRKIKIKIECIILDNDKESTYETF